MKTKRFQKKDVIFCCGNKTRQLHLSPIVQVLGLICLIAVAYWSVQTSVQYMYGNELIASRDATIATQKKQNEVLSKDLAYYKGRVDAAEKLAQDVQDSHKDILEKVDVLVSDEVKKTNDKFGRVQKTLKDAGVSFHKVLDNVTPDGVGGPYIPEISSDLLKEDYSVLLASVYEKLSYLEAMQHFSGLAPISSPVDEDMYVASAFGGRKDPFTGEKSRHNGIDLGGHFKSPVRATAPGVVKRAFANGSFGNFVEIEHAGGFVTRYAHLHQILVKAGDRVETGDQVGTLGNTGRSTGKHLHYEILVNDRPVNPYRFIVLTKGE